MATKKHGTADSIGELVSHWLTTNHKTPAQVRHDIYPVGFVASLIEQLEKLGQTRLVVPTARTFAHHDPSVINESEAEQQKELQRMTDWWLIWRNDWRNPTLAHGADGRAIPTMPQF